jgi:hypothetical protein
LYERFIQHAIRAMLSYAPIEGPGGSNSTIGFNSGRSEGKKMK